VRATDSGESPGDEALQLLGLARRAGCVALGVAATARAIRDGRAKLVIAASDASPVQLAKLGAGNEASTVPRREAGDRRSLGHALGGGPVSAVAVTEAGFAEQLLRRLPDPDSGRGRT